MARAGILTPDECRQISKGLKMVLDSCVKSRENEYFIDAANQFRKGCIKAANAKENLKLNIMTPHAKLRNDWMLFLILLIVGTVVYGCTKFVDDNWKEVPAADLSVKDTVVKKQGWDNNPKY